MKVSSVLIGGIASAPLLIKAIVGQVSEIPISPWETGKDITFAALVWFLVGWVIPNIMKAHREEREERDKAHREERDKWTASMERIDERHEHIIARLTGREDT